MPKVRLNNVTREAALAALFNRAKPQGLGMLQYDKAHVMTENEARVVLMDGDYVNWMIDCAMDSSSNVEAPVWAYWTIRNKLPVHMK